MTATVTRGGPAAGNAAGTGAPARRADRRRRPGFPSASTTPGKVGPGSAGTLFGRLEADLGAAIRADQEVFAGSATAGSGAFTGLAAGIAVLALAMAAGCAWGLSRRLAEYR